MVFFCYHSRDSMKELVKKFIPKSLLLFYHNLLTRTADIFYDHPSRKMIIIGVTGTTGKTTVCNLIAKILEEAGFKVGLTTTANFKIADKEWVNDLKQTMLGRFALQRLLSQMVQAGCQYAVIETTSEGIAQYRHLGIDYDLAVFCNLTPEHIERHGSFENYNQAKGKLFASLSKNKKQLLVNNQQLTINKVSIVNLDDEHAGYFLGFGADEKIGYSIKNQRYKSKIKKIKAENIGLSSGGVNFNVQGISINLKLLGKFNVSNALAAICVGLSQNIDLNIIKKALEKVRNMPGRMEIINEGQDFTVIVDYAHEPVGLENVYQTIQLMAPKRIISLLGSQGGGRDVRKRPVLGKLAAQYTDDVIVTNEDPYDEDPQAIIDQVTAGALEKDKVLGQNLWKILNRKEAIKKAILLAKAGDIVVITGKGSEKHIVSKNNKKIPHDDRDVVRQILRSLRQTK